MNGRVFLALILGAFAGAIFISFFWNTLNQRLFIPLAKWLRFKKDDTERVEKEVEKILGDTDEKSKSDKKSRR